jgi:death-on-curing family protein
MYPLPTAASLNEACEAAALQLVSDILLIHVAVTEPFGSSSALISYPLLDSAVHRPFYSFGSDFMYNSGLEQAAALFKSLAQNHAFEDGNKRTAITVCLYFLFRCGYWTHGEGLLTDKEAQELERLTLLVAQETILLHTGALPARLEIPDLARAIDDILGSSRGRRPRLSRRLSQAFRGIYRLFGD